MNNRIYKINPESATLCLNGKSEILVPAPKYSVVNSIIENKTKANFLLDNKNIEIIKIKISIR